jgi:hypothetical protein
MAEYAAAMASHVKALAVSRTVWRCVAVAALVLALMPTHAAAASTTDEFVRAALRDEVAAAADSSAGVLFGVLDRLGAEPRIWTEGAVSADDELKLGCPTAKPILAYLTLHRRIPLDARITRWFPEREGYTRARDIPVRDLMLNSSGIRDYVPLIPVHPDSAVTPERTIELAYRNRPLLFEPGQGFEYSNTNASLLGCILKRETGRSVDALVRARFAAIAPSLRYDDGHGRYPRGYVRPWPYHWSCPGYGGGLIGTAADAMRAFAWIASQPEFVEITRWSKPDGSPEPVATDHGLGLGLFSRKDLAGCGPAAFYDGDIGPCQMILARVRGRVFYIATTRRIGLERLNAVFARLVAKCVADGSD